MKKIIKKVKQWYCKWMNNEREARVNKIKKLANDYCKVGDLDGQPCVLIDGVPLFMVTDKETSLTSFQLNVKDSAEVINQIRMSYVNTVLHD